jgi:hypothetical protein
MPDTMKSDIMKTALDDLISGDMPAPATIREIFNQIMDGDVSPVRISAFLIALKMRGERVEDIAAAASVMREKALTTFRRRLPLLWRDAGCLWPSMAIKLFHRKVVRLMCYHVSISNLIVICRLSAMHYIRLMFVF